MKRKTRKVLSMLLSLVMVLSCIPCMTTSAFAAGKTIKQIDILGLTYPEIGKEAKTSGITVPEDAGYEITSATWVAYPPNQPLDVMEEGEKFQGGIEYRLWLVVEIKSSKDKFYGSTDVERRNMDVTVNGEQILDDGKDISNSRNLSCYCSNSTNEDTKTQVRGVNLMFEKLGGDMFGIGAIPDVPEGRVYEDYKLYLNTTENDELYNYGGSGTLSNVRKVSGPDWLTISKQGKLWVLKGTRPSYTAPPADMTIEMTDTDGNVASKTIKVGAVLADDRLTYVNVNTEYPKIGNHPGEITLSDDYSRAYYWYDDTAKKRLTSDDTFEAGHVYRINSVIFRVYNLVPYSRLEIRFNGYLNGNTIQPFETIRTNYGSLILELDYVFPALTYGPMTGTVRYTSAANPGSKVTTAVTGLPSGLASDKVSYQWQVKSSGVWSDISGATDKQYTPAASQLGKQIRLTISGEGYSGTIAGPAVTVTKLFNSAKPSAPSLTAEKDSGGNYTVLNISNYSSSQEYVYRTSPESDSQSIDWDKDKITSAKTTLTAGGLYYVYTRYKETSDTQAGYGVNVSSIKLQDRVYLQSVVLDGYRSTTSGGWTGNTIYIKKGTSVTIPVKMNPSNATTSTTFRFKNQSGDQLYTLGSGKEDYISASAADMPSSITINAGNTTGKAVFGAFYNEVMYNYGKWNIVIYDPADVDATYINAENPPAYGDVTLIEGDTYTPESKDLTNVLAPAEANSQCTLEWRVCGIASSNPYFTETENPYIKVDPSTGKITALKSTEGLEGYDRYYTTVKLIALKDGNRVTEVASYNVNVDTKAVSLDSITLSTDSAELTPGGSAYLNVSMNPSNAEVTGSVTWERISGSDRITVDASGKVTAASDAPDGATAVIQASLDGKTAVCNVKVNEIRHSISAENGKLYDVYGKEISSAASGTQVIAVADAAPEGKEFDRWDVISGGVTIAGVNSPTTSFITGDEDVSIIAVYRDRGTMGSGLLPITNMNIKLSASSLTYNGKSRVPTVTVKDSGTTLKKGTDYTVKYSNNKYVGTAKVTITGIGAYTGSVVKTFKINPTKVTVSSVKKAASGKMKVTWKKHTTQTTGFQVQYSTYSTFKSAKTVTVSGSKATTKTISKLKKGKKYYVRVRSYKTVNGTKYYSSWSAKKSVRV